MKQTRAISPTFCVFPWMETIIDPKSFFAPCCVATPIKDKQGRHYNLVEDGLDNYWNGYGLRKIRERMLNGEKVKACHWCYYQESIGDISFRKEHNKQWLESKYKQNILDRVEKSRINGYRVAESPLLLDIRPGNLCNLKCRMCNPLNSSQIEQEQKELLRKNLDIDFIDTNYFKFDRKFFNWHKNKELWKTIYKWSPGLKSIYFTGGEPTLIKENWDFIDYLKKKGYSKNIELVVNTNCMQCPDKLTATFEDFHCVRIMFSVDGYKEVQEYIRHPSKWGDIEKNIIKMLRRKKKNVYFSFSPVVSVYNILNLPHLLRWIDELHALYGYVVPYLMLCIGYKFLSISILPKNVKELALSKIEEYESSYNKGNTYLLEQINSIKNVLKSKEKEGIEKKLKMFYKYTMLLDQYRGNSFEKTFPELNALLNDDGRWKV